MFILIYFPNLCIAYVQLKSSPRKHVYAQTFMK